VDPLTQGVVGAVAAQQPAKKTQIVVATLLGFLSGMAPDLDVLIRSNADPLLALEFHRQFTHSLFFIPFGGLLCAAPLHVLFAKRCHLRFVQTYGFCTLGYATHGMLDAWTTYGTQLFWPFSSMRVAWHTVSIIDPLYTVPLLGLMVHAVLKKNKRSAVGALLWAASYGGVGLVQRERAEQAGWELAASRGHQPVALEAKPSFANLLVWKIVYTTEKEYYVDAVRMGLSTRTYPGKSIPQLDITEAFPWLDMNSQQARDIERFRWFSNGYIALSPHHPNRVIDVRYSMLPNDIQGLWGIELNQYARPDSHVAYVFNRNHRPEAMTQLWAMLAGQ